MTDKPDLREKIDDERLARLVCDAVLEATDGGCKPDYRQMLSGHWDEELGHFTDLKDYIESLIRQREQAAAKQALEGPHLCLDCNCMTRRVCGKCAEHKAKQREQAAYDRGRDTERLYKDAIPMEARYGK